MWKTKNATPAKTIELRKRKVILAKLWENFFVKMFFFVLLFVILFVFFVGIKRIDRMDMYPALRDGDYILYLKPQVRDYISKDMVVYDTEDGERVGRIQCIENDELDTYEGILTINDKTIPIQKDLGLYYETKAGKKINYPISLKKNQYFILGDKRDTSEDSRTYGPIDGKNIKGKVFAVIRSRTL